MSIGDIEKWRKKRKGGNDMSCRFISFSLAFFGLISIIVGRGKSSHSRLSPVNTHTYIYIYTYILVYYVPIYTRMNKLY
ncbi:hypothetical protein F5X96DRAFT_613593, partial [Biscogniauxia mediterranea]